jgi:hypothetical protein
MKKIYTLVKVLILSVIFYSTANAQPCATGIAYPTIYVQENSCYVYIENSTPNANVNLYNAANVRINLPISDEAKTDANGYATAVYYDCNTSVDHITLSTPTGTCTMTNISAPAVFPIKLTSFSAFIGSESSVRLKWSSAQEFNSLKFGVEKSGDGKSFSEIGTVAAAGNSTRNIDYAFEDKNFSSTAFYRLRMVDIDGHTEFSKVVYVNNGKGGTTTLSVFPNPFKSDIQLKGVSASEINAQNVKVYNVAGKQVAYRITGSNSISIDGNLPQGIYILRVKDQNYKLIKE